YVELRDVYGNTYTYAHLKSVSRAYPVPKPRHVSKATVQRELRLPKADPRPTTPASAGTQNAPAATVVHRVAAQAAPVAHRVAPRKERLFAHPSRPAAYRHGGETQLLDAGAA